MAAKSTGKCPSATSAMKAGHSKMISYPSATAIKINAGAGKNSVSSPVSGNKSSRSGH